MPFTPFLIFSTMGTVLWVSFLTYAGYVLGDNFAQIKEILAPVSQVVLTVLAVGFIGWIIRRKFFPKTRGKYLPGERH